mmetsp:Transcript_22866/g.50122  ORF Transcript_22866/g.50122 Transcript_22866/m.50122 type:complete len:219 (-) Transcript_22866:95-751(-)
MCCVGSAGLVEGGGDDGVLNYMEKTRASDAVPPVLEPCPRQLVDGHADVLLYRHARGRLPGLALHHVEGLLGRERVEEDLVVPEGGEAAGKAQHHVAPHKAGGQDGVGNQAGQGGAHVAQDELAGVVDAPVCGYKDCDNGEVVVQLGHLVIRSCHGYQLAKEFGVWLSTYRLLHCVYLRVCATRHNGEHGHCQQDWCEASHLSLSFCDRPQAVTEKYF